ncbi:8-amino-7-oxononanoate synthase [uncultured Allomuricauda sp.]|uniref:aminotransferase class I/II-fold pyridoxal phosphate-dependent enzyme n=1 Tax=Flagellimonas sp. W118 TaxID=3410791 RepID=UPI00260F6170|nr:8-amino-7-oxononanoate synthase [uncultured Allomuricauda sp.]
MAKLPKKLEQKLEKRRLENALRTLPNTQALVDFSSNDYLGLARKEELIDDTLKFLKTKKTTSMGSTGSRLLTGNHILYEELEDFLADYHNSESALVFNSGYDANIGFFSSVPQRGDFIFYDELAHASIRDGIQMNNAKSYKFAHNNLNDLRSLIGRNQNTDENSEIYIVTESVFSMDGDSPDLVSLVDFCSHGNYHLIVDEAHAVGVFGEGKGMISQLGIEDKVFARVVTFGKALGNHGAAILGGEALRTYLLNFARSLIYTTALSPHSIASILTTYHYLQEHVKEERTNLLANITYFKQQIQSLSLENNFIVSNSAIHCLIVSGNQMAKDLSRNLKDAGFDVRPILSPTVKAGEERLRFCLHSYNTKEEISRVLSLVKNEIV